MQWSWRPVGKYSIGVVTQLNVECSVWAGKQSWKWIDIKAKTSSTHMQLVARNLAFSISHTSILRDKALFYMRSLQDRGLGSTSSHFSTCERHLSGGDGSAFPFPHRAYYTWTQGESAGLSQHFSSLLVRPPSTDPLQAMWVGQTDFLTQGFIWGNSEKGTRLFLT